MLDFGEDLSQLFVELLLVVKVPHFLAYMYIVLALRHFIIVRRNLFLTSVEPC